MSVVFCLSGPDRAIDETVSSISSLQNLPEIKIIVHLWESEDLGSGRIKQIEAMDFVQYVMVSPDLEKRGFESQLEELQAPNTESVTKNMVSMFWGVKECLDFAVEKNPNATHLIRVRTDLGLRPGALEFPIEDRLVVSKSANIPISWPSDHFMGGQVDSMMRIWGHASIPELIEEFVEAKKNAEYMVMRRLQMSGERKAVRIYRFIDYDIIRKPPREEDVDSWFKWPLTIYRFFGSRVFFRPLMIFFSFVSSVKHEAAFRARRIP